MSSYNNNACPRYRQGDILRDVTIVEWAEVSGEAIEIRERELAYCVVLSQDCDLEHDHNSRESVAGQAPKNNDKFLQTVLLCPAYPAEAFRAGTHLQALQLQMQKFSSDEWRKLIQNNLYRYHFLKTCPELQVPDLVLDFKHYFTVARDIIYRDDFRKSYLVTLADLFREHLSQRFANYLSRIGLPEPVI